MKHKRTNSSSHNLLCKLHNVVNEIAPRKNWTLVSQSLMVGERIKSANNHLFKHFGMSKMVLLISSSEKIMSNYPYFIVTQEKMRKCVSLKTYFRAKSTNQLKFRYLNCSSQVVSGANIRGGKWGISRSNVRWDPRWPFKSTTLGTS